jgi:hypothetical protein
LADKDLSLWKGRLNLSHRKHKKEIEDNIKRYRKYYRGDQWLSEAARGAYNDQIVVNMVFANIKTILPSINFKNPKIFAKARKKPYRTPDGGYFDTLSAAIIYELLLNYYYQELDIKRQVDLCLMDALIGPWGIAQIGYTTKTEKIKDGELLEILEFIREESPYVQRISPLDFRVDPEAKDSRLSDAKWTAVKWVKDLSDVKRTDKYSNTSKLKSNYTAGIEDSPGAVKSPDDKWVTNSEDFQRVEGWDIWDRKTNKLITIVETHDKMLFEDDWPLTYEGFPQEIIYFNENPDELFPVSDINIYLPQQDELNRIRSLQLEHIKKISQRKYLSQQNMLSEEEKRKITHGPSGTIAESTGDPERALVPIKDANISQDIYLIARLLKEDIREESGIPQFDQGIAQKFDTATEPALIAQGSQNKKGERMQIVENFVCRIMRKFAEVLQQTMSDQSIPLSNNQHQEVMKYIPHKLEKIAGDNSTVILPWLNASKDDIQGEYDFEIEVGSMLPDNKEQRKKDAVTMWQMFSQDQYFDPVSLRKKILEAFEVKDLELKDPQVVQQEQMQQGQTMLAAEQAKQQPKHQTDLAKTQMKNQTALAGVNIKSQTTLEAEKIRARTVLLSALLNKDKGNQNK